MFLLLLVSFIQAFSFGLIGKRLAGVDTTAVATIRLGLAFLVFLPFFRRGALPMAASVRLAVIGAIQFGVMYLLYQRSFVYLPSHAIALFVIPMPLYVTIAAAISEGQWRARYAIAALLGIAGGATVTFRGGLEGNYFHGFVLMQLSNICFAVGQIAWRHERRKLGPGLRDSSIFALPYAGALAASFIGSLFFTNWSTVHPTAIQWLVLAYLGIVSSGLCFFWWNLGATRVSAGILAVMNNAKIPLAVACSLVFFGEKADVPRLLAAGGLMGAGVWLAQRKTPT